MRGSTSSSQWSLTLLGFQLVPLGGRNDCDSISLAAEQTGQTTGGSADRGHCPLLSISPFSPLLLVPDNGQPMRACQHFLDDKGIPHTWADWCPNPGLLCTCCMCHIIGGGAVHGEVEQLYRHPIPPPFRPRGAFQIIAASQFNMWHEMLVKTRGSLCKSVSLHIGKHLIVHFVFNDRDGHKSAKVLIRSRSCLDFDGSCSQRVGLSLSNILIHATASHCRQCTGGHLRELLINNWLYINAASFSKVLSYCMCGKKNVLAKVIISGSVF